ncbi:preprotein translocase subunit YajC [Jatrophihabitans sp. YIM 134969]
MGQYAPLIIIGALLLVMVVMSNRNKAKKAAADVERRNSLVPGTRAMTTSGMYGTITAVNPENDGSQADTVTLEIAPGVAVDWALAAVREAPQRIAPLTATDPSDANGEVVDPTAEPVDGPVRMVKPKGRAGER